MPEDAAADAPPARRPLDVEPWRSTSSRSSPAGLSGFAPSATSPTRSQAGSSLELIDIRAHTPLGAGQVDDTPFGGGAGMLLRVDVIDSALRARYGVDPVECATPGA